MTLIFFLKKMPNPSLGKTTKNIKGLLRKAFLFALQKALITTSIAKHGGFINGYKWLIKALKSLVV